jgi:hypothetical protein
MHCRMIDYTIRDNRMSGVFEALSYVWGKTTNPSKIFVADLASTVDSNPLEQYLEITSNLYDALQELRDPTLPRIMWIDAVCINQDDLEERSSQVNFMAKIYSYANQVVIWLGPEDGTKTQELFTAIEDAAELARQITGAQQVQGTEHSGDYPRTDFLGTALESLLSRPWFSRVWVLQEAASARSLLVKCGVFELPGSIFTNGVRYLQTHSFHRNERARGLGASVLETMVWYTSGSDRPFSKHLTDDLREGRTSRTPSLGDIIERFHLHGVTDRRDTIFALLNLSTSDSRGSIKSDYTKSWSTIWTDTIKQILGSQTVVTICSRDQACLTVSGYVLGTIKLNRDGSLFMKSIYPSGPLAWRALWGPKPWCNPESWCKHIQNDDIVFFTRGSAAPSIIRACGDHFDIIVIAVPAPLNTRSDSTGFSLSDFDWHELLSSLTYSPRRASLVWDWCAEYPDSCTHHPLLFDGVLATPVPHPNNISRIEDSANVIATILPLMNHSTSKISTASQRSLDYMLQQSDNPKFPSLLQTRLQLLRMLLHSNNHKDLYAWLVGQFEITRQIFWIICHHTNNLTSCKWIFDYHRSERHPYYNIFDVISIVGLEVCPQKDDQKVSLYLTDTADTHNSKYLANLFGNQIVSLYLTDTPDTHNSNYFANLFGNGVWQNYDTLTPSFNQQRRCQRKERVWTAQCGVRQYLIAAVIRHSSFTPADIRISPESLHRKPLIPLRRNNRLRELQPSVNLRAFALIFECQPGKSALSWSGPRRTTTDPHVLIMSICLFSKPQISIQMAYSILSAVFGLAPNAPPMCFPERIYQGGLEENLGEHHLSQLIFRQLSFLTGRRPSINRTSCHSLVSLFISHQLETLTRYIESTEILDIAAATADDNFLPFLRKLLDLDHGRNLSLQDYREHMMARFAARHDLPPPSDSECV